MIKTESKAIGERGYTYTVQQLGAREGGRLLVRLAKMLGKPIGEAVAAGDLDAHAVGSVISGLAETVSEADYEHLREVFAKCSTVSGGNSSQSAQLQYGGASVPLSNVDIFDLHFACAYVELLGWLAFAMEVNFGGFLSVMQAAKGGLLNGLPGSLAPQRDPAQPSQSPST